MTQTPQHAELARALARLWPHREHEAGPLRSLCCRMGVHRWRRLSLDALDLPELTPERDVRFCFWCSKVKIDGVIYGT